MNFFYYKEKKGNNKIIHILGLKFTKSIVQTKCVTQLQLTIIKKQL